jgi:hypothetical protein
MKLLLLILLALVAVDSLKSTGNHLQIFKDKVDLGHVKVKTNQHREYDISNVYLDDDDEYYLKLSFNASFDPYTKKQGIINVVNKLIDIKTTNLSFDTRRIEFAHRVLGTGLTELTYSRITSCEDRKHTEHRNLAFIKLSYIKINELTMRSTYIANELDTLNNGNNLVFDFEKKAQDYYNAFITNDALNDLFGVYKKNEDEKNIQNSEHTSYSSGVSELKPQFVEHLKVKFAEIEVHRAEVIKTLDNLIVPFKGQSSLKSKLANRELLKEYHILRAKWQNQEK